MARVLVIDNYDSFTYNLVHLLREQGHEVDVYRNDKITVEQAAAWHNILLSPGPGVPSEAGILLDLIRQLAATHNILGVCLGHQAIGEAFGNPLQNLEDVYHGVATRAHVTGDASFFAGVPNDLEVGRYHSWIVASLDSNGPLQATAVDEQGKIMALKHQSYALRGVQFHPESILTPHGPRLLQNWLATA